MRGNADEGLYRLLYLHLALQALFRPRPQAKKGFAKPEKIAVNTQNLMRSHAKRGNEKAFDKKLLAQRGRNKTFSK